MKQVLIIHGGSSFANKQDHLDYLNTLTLDYQRLKYQKKWKPWIAEMMHDTDVLLPSFPSSDNADFNEWKIYFEKIIPLLADDIQIVGHSLGAMFLAKYLQTYPLNRKVNKLILIAGQYSADASDVGSFDIHNASLLTKSADEIHLFHSEDDVIVPFENVHTFHRDLPTAKLHLFSDRGHFNGATFPELLELLQQK